MHRKSQLLFFCICLSFLTQAQSNLQLNAQGGNSFMNDISGRPLYAKTEYVAEGSPYLFEEYHEADITLGNGNVYKGVKIKINLAENKLLYMAVDGTEMIATTPVLQVKMPSPFNIENSIIIHSLNKPFNVSGAPIYQLLVSGKAKLFKQISVDYNDRQGYNEATVTRVFSKRETFFAVLPGKDSSLQKVDKNKTAVSMLFGAKNQTVLTFINTQKLNCKLENDLVAIFRFYNGLE